MARAPHLKIYNKDGTYIAACKYAEDAAQLVSSYGDGASIRHEHNLVVWREGSEAQPAAESYDYVAEVVNERVRSNSPASFKCASLYCPGFPWQASVRPHPPTVCK